MQRNESGERVKFDPTVDSVATLRNTLLTIIPSILLALLVAYFKWPRYIELNIPFPEDVRATYTEKSTISWGPGDTDWVWRRHFISGISSESSFDSKQKIFDYVSEWLIKKGWQPHTIDGSLCSPLSQSSFLDKGDGYLEFRPRGSGLYDRTDVVCVAVWNEVKNRPTEFEILILTSKPSPGG